tara:strand:- start:711 stop:878 length:168 start_codon:yes stop_codon:yes gene_type:complete
MNKINLGLLGLLAILISIFLLYKSMVINEKKLHSELELIKSLIADIDNDIHELTD